MAYGANRLRPGLAARLERAERSQALDAEPSDAEGRIAVDPSTYALLRRLHELDPALFDAYARAHYGYIHDPWKEAGHPPPAPELVCEATKAFWELWREQDCRQLAEKTGDRLILALWRAYALERDDLRAGKYIHPACVTNINTWLLDPGWAERNRGRNVSFWLSPFRRAVDHRERALRQDGAAPIEDPREAERLASEQVQRIVSSHLTYGRHHCARLGVPFELPSDGAADGERS